MTYVEYGYACEDCVCAIANGDFSGMDDARASEIRTALDAIAEPLQVGEEQGFMHYACDVCGTPAGNRHAIGYLAEKPWLYSDGVLTAREVMSESDSARLVWRASWRLVRRERRHEPLWTPFHVLETRVVEMLMRHHCVAPRTAELVARHISGLRELRSRDRAVPCSADAWQLLRGEIREQRLQPRKFRRAKWFSGSIPDDVPSESWLRVATMTPLVRRNQGVTR